MNSTENTKKIELFLPFAVFLVYIVFLLNTDIFGLVFFYMGDNNAFYGNIAIVLGVVLTIAVIIKVKGYFVVYNYEIDILGCCIIFLIILLGLLRGVIPDTSSDVIRSHIFFQQPGFEENIDYNVFPAGYSFYFYLSDDFSFYFRKLLGYRMGTLCNSCVLILVFFEVRKLLDDFCGEKLNSIRVIVCEKAENSPFYGIFVILFSSSFFSGIAVLNFYSVSELGTYMTDLVCIPILVFLIRETLKDGWKEECHVVFFAFMSGIAFGLKQTCIVILVPTLLIYILKNLKSITPFIFIKCFIVGVFPAAPYMLYAYTSTGNPVYFMYNALFKSPYYFDINFKDDRWGPETLVQAILWPLKLAFNSRTRVSEVIDEPLTYISLGFITVLQVIVCFILKKREVISKNAYLLDALFVISVFLWIITTGYGRYAIPIEIVAVILVAIGMINRYEIGYKWHWGLTLMISCVLFVQFGTFTVRGLINAYDWSWRGKITDNYKSGVLLDNVKWIFRDRELSIPEDENVDYFLVAFEGTAFATLCNPDIPIIGISNIVQYLGGLENVKGINYVEKYKKMIQKLIEDEKDVCGIEKINCIENCVNMANIWELEISQMKWMESYFVDNEELAFIEYKKAKYPNTISALYTEQKIEKMDDRSTKLNGYLYIHPYYKNDCSEVLFTVVSGDGRQTNYNIPINSDEIFDLSELNPVINLKPSDDIYISVIGYIQPIYSVNMRVEE